MLMQSVVRCFMCVENKSHVLSTRFHCGYWVALHYNFTIYLLTRKWKLLIFWHNSSSITAVPLWSKSFIIAIVFCWPFAFLTSLFELQQLIPHLSLLMSVCHLADFSIDFTVDVLSLIASKAIKSVTLSFFLDSRSLFIIHGRSLVPKCFTLRP